MSVKTADVVIIGSGAMGSCTAYHLAKKGIKNIIVLEKSYLLGGHSSCHCAGGIRHQFSSEINVRFTILNKKLWNEFQAENGYDFRQIDTGYMFAMTKEDDPTPFKEAMKFQRELGVDASWISSEEIQKMIPKMNCSDLIGGTFCKEDGLVDAGIVMNSYITECQKLGVKFYTNVEVTNLLVEQGKIKGVVTNEGKISTDIVVNAAGPWSPKIFKMANIQVPVRPIHEQLMITEDMSWIHEKIPVVIFPSNGLGFHIEGNGLLIGLHKEESYGKGYKMGIDIQNEITACQMICERIPRISEVKIKGAWYGFYDTTPDNNPIIGKIEELEGFYSLTGFSGHGFMHSSAAGLLLSEEIVEGKASTLEIEEFSIKRFQNNTLGIAEFYKI